jgi:hypothetical protein
MPFPERPQIEYLYSQFHRIIEELDISTGAVNLNTRSALRSFADAVHRDDLPRKRFKRYLGKEDEARLMEFVDAYPKQERIYITPGALVEPPIEDDPDGSEQ